jgi:hypothetical protein
MTPKRIGFIGFNGVTALHLTGAADAFAAATLDNGYGSHIPCYEVCSIGLRTSDFDQNLVWFLSRRKQFTLLRSLTQLLFLAGAVSATRKPRWGCRTGF